MMRIVSNTCKEVAGAAAVEEGNLDCVDVFIFTMNAICTMMPCLVSNRSRSSAENRREPARSETFKTFLALLEPPRPCFPETPFRPTF